MKEVVAGYLTGETVVVLRLMMKAVVVVNSMLLLADLV